MNIAALVEAPVERQATAGIKEVLATAVAHLARHAIPEAELLAQNGLGVATLHATQALRLGADINAGTGNRPNVLAAAAGYLQQQLRLDQCRHHRLQGFLLLLRIQRLAGLKGALQPVLGPGGLAGFAHQLLKAALTAVAGGEAGPRRGGAKAGGVGDLLVEHVSVSATGEQVGAAFAVLAQQLRNLKAPTLPPVMQQPHH